jgi:uncharacterized protein
MAQELFDVELHRIGEFLSQVAGGVIPNTEALDGFFAALVCCPDLAMPGEFLRVLQSGETEAFDLVLRNEAEAQEFIALVMRHSSHLNAQLTFGEVYFP